MPYHFTPLLLVCGLVFGFCPSTTAFAQPKALKSKADAAPGELDLSRPDPKTNPTSALMMDLPEIGRKPESIDFSKLPRLPAEHAVVSRGTQEWKFRLHNYLTFHDGRFWCIWSHGPVIEDQATQHIQFSTSPDGLKWSEPQVLVGPPKEGYGYIARGLWLRDGELLALASLYEAPTFANGDLSLEAFRWAKDENRWQPAGTVLDDSLNNFAPKKLPSGEWMMTRRNAKRDVSIMVGGVKALNDWRVFPLAGYAAVGGQRPEEPVWYILPDGQNIVGLFRNNDGKRLLRSFSSDEGRTWSPLVVTNFPDARSKFFCLRTSKGYYAMVGNPNPTLRNPLCLSASKDGLVYTAMSVLPIPEQLPPLEGAVDQEKRPRRESFQYPHVIEHDGALYIAYSRGKLTVEVLKVPLSAVDRMVK